MDAPRNEAIKKAVRAGFDASPTAYEDFERVTGLFSFLSTDLARRAVVAPGMAVVDVGCGTGISTEILIGLVGKDGRVIGIDLSPAMLQEARRRAPRAGFIEGDAEKLGELVEVRPGSVDKGAMDAVLYNACIFLLPDAPSSLKGARSILMENGTVAMNFIEGVYAGGRELFRELFPEWTGNAFPAPRFPCDTAKLEDMLAQEGFREVRRGTVEKEMDVSGLRRFYSVPAQSASLYPRLAVDDRRREVGRMFDLAEERGIRSASMRWIWLTGRS